MKQFPSATLAIVLPALFVSFLMAACGQPAAQQHPTENAADGAQPSLHEAFAGAFLVGAALAPDQFFERDSVATALVKKHFSSITSENVLKWAEVQPEPGRYDWRAADRFVEFGEENDMFIVGHTLVWHNQTPEWVFQDGDGQPLDREALLERMRNHIHTVVGRYKGRIDGWDVVNEALNEDGTLRETPWMRIIGEDYLEKAFQFAHEADPDAELYYNDYSLENPAKRDGAVRLVQGLLDKGIPVAGIGTQGHHMLPSDMPSVEAQEATIEAFADLGVDVMITELDIAVLPRPQRHWGADITQSAELRDELNPYPDALPDSMQQALAQRYADLFAVFLEHQDKISRVTFWGVRDSDSWLNNWPIRGRTSYPLLFDKEGRPKPAFYSVVGLAGE